jgi:ATP-dependent DNA helicase RecG
MYYNDAELEVLYETPEKDHVERKRSTNLKNEILRCACAFANDLPNRRRAGVIFIGVDDEGRCANLTISEKTVREIANWRNEGRVLPIPTITVESKNIAGCPLVVMQILPSNIPPVRFDGEIIVAIGSTRTVASEADEARLNEKRGAAPRPFDTRSIPELDFKELDLARFESEYLPGAVSPEVLAANERTTEQRLKALRLSDVDGHPTAAAILVLGKTPQAVFPGAYIQALKINGTSLTDQISDQKEISGTLVDQVREVDLIIRAWNSVGADISSSVRKDQPTYPEVALRQLIRNALMHRTYEATNTPTRLVWYSDRVEILSPGGPYGIITKANFGQPNLTDYRNPTIADAMKTLGIVERFGFGIPAAREACEKNGNPPPEFTADPTHVLALIRGPQQ